jgi:HEAT repeat protein
MVTDVPLRSPEEQLTLLSHHLGAEHGGLLIVATPDTEAEHALVEEVQLRLQAKVAIEQVTFTAESVEHLSLSHHLSTLPQHSGKAAVFVFGLDDLPPAARTTAINAMNWGRERLRWSGCTVVLWVRPHTPGELGNRAPDFFSWRSDVFEFDIPNDFVTRRQLLTQLRLFAPATLEELRQRYRDYVVRTYQWLDFRGLLQLRNVVRLPLEDVFVPLEATITLDYPPLPESLTSASLSEAELQRYKHQRLERRVTLAEAVHHHQRLVVLGDPGSGKSTLLRFLALTFAQGVQQVQERFGIDEDRLPILVPLSTFAEARKRQPALSIVDFLPRYFIEQGLPDFSTVFEDALQRGQALVLLDGLDEMLTYHDRAAAAHAVTEFAAAYPASRVIISSRIAGYTPNMLPASFTPITVAPFDHDAIKQFTRQWSLAFEAIGLPTYTELPLDLRRRAELRAESLTTAATSHPGVKRLATNPLLLTLLALIHHQGTRLPNRRTELYRLCIEALAETWNLARSLSGRPIDLHLGQRRLDEEFVIHLLGPVAYWMHENKPTGIISRKELEGQLVEQFKEDGASAEKATAQAHDFVDLAREQMGLLAERASDEFSFLHLSFQEYLAARFLSERKDAFERLRPRLHQPRWREVVLLTAGCLHGDYATEFVENILNAHGPFETLMQRITYLDSDQPRGSSEVKSTLLSLADFLLAAHCIGDGVPVPRALTQSLCGTLFTLWRDPPFDWLVSEVASIFSYLSRGTEERSIRNFLLDVAKDKTLNFVTRLNTVLELEQTIRDNLEASRVIRHILHDKTDSVFVRSFIASTLEQVRLEETEGAITLLNTLQDKSEDIYVRGLSASWLGSGWSKEPEVIETLLRFVRDKEEKTWLRNSVISALGKTQQMKDEVTEILLELLQNTHENILDRKKAAIGIGNLRGPQEERITTILLNLLQDRSESWEIRVGVARSLEKKGGSGLSSILLNIIHDAKESKEARRGALEALGRVVQREDEIVTTLLAIAQDKNENEEIREQAVAALGQVGQEKREEAISTLLVIIRNQNEAEEIHQRAIESLGQLGQGKSEVIEILLRAAEDPILRSSALNALWNLLPQLENLDE